MRRLTDGARLPRPADPDRDRLLHRQRVDALPIKPVPAPLEVHRLFRPQPPQDLDLLVAAPAAGMEVLPEGSVVLRARPHAHPKAEPPPAEPVDLGRLLRHYHRLPCRQHDYRRHQLDRLRVRRHPGQQRQWLVRVVDPHRRYAIGHAQVGEPQLVRLPREPCHAGVVVLQVPYGNGHSDPHAYSSFGHHQAAPLAGTPPGGASLCIDSPPVRKAMRLLRRLAIVLLGLADVFWLLVVGVAMFGNGVSFFNFTWWAILLTVTSIFVFWYLVFALIQSLWRRFRRPNFPPEGEDRDEPTDRSRSQDAGGRARHPAQAAGRRSPRSGRLPDAGS